MIKHMHMCTLHRFFKKAQDEGKSDKNKESRTKRK